MASGPRKARVEPNELPPVIKIGTDNYGYLVRHRVISEDRNRFSAWSTVQTVPAFDTNNLPPAVDGNIADNGNSIQVVWDDAVDRPRYDIFVGFDGAPLEYHGTSPIHSYSFLKTPGSAQVNVNIQIESINKELSSVLTIAELSATIGS